MTMSTGRRLAKRSIIGTKVCAPGPDGLWYSGIIQDVKTTPTATITNSEISSDICSENANVDQNADYSTRYIVRFDFKTQTTVHTDPDKHNVNLPRGRGRPSNAVLAAAQNNLSQTIRRNAMIKEFRDEDLIGPGFRSINGIQLQNGQRVYITHNGRETSGDVVQHDINKDEVIIKIIQTGLEVSFKIFFFYKKANIIKSFQ